MCVNTRLVGLYQKDLEYLSKLRGSPFLVMGLGLVKQVVTQTKIPINISFLDLIQEGNLAVISFIQDLNRWGISHLSAREFQLLAKPRIQRAIDAFIKLSFL